MAFENSLDFAKSMDNKDPLRKFRSEFILPPFKERNAIYFLGNSLGLQPKQTAYYIEGVLTEWATYGVEGFFKGSNPWLEYHEQLVQPLAMVIGALPAEVVVMNQLTVNLHLMLSSFYNPSGRRRKILCEAKAFPSDQYMLQTQIERLGFDPDDIIIEVTPREGEAIIHHEDIIAAINENKEELAMVFWGGVHYYTGQAFDIGLITSAAHEAGALAGFDLAHAAGNIELKLHDWNVDFASWCSYKYLNSGPGAIGGAYIHERYHQGKNIQRLGGWWGNRKETRFQMKKEFDPSPTAEGWQLSTPSILLYAAHKAALEIFSRAGISSIIEKGSLLNDYALFLIGEINRQCGRAVVRVITPERKGCQLSMLVEEGRKVFDQLTSAGVFADWREPDVIRIAPVPLYNTFEEVWKFGKILEQAIINLHA